MHRFFEGCPEVGGTDAGDATEHLGPGLVVFFRVVRSAPGDQAAHAVADERDLLDRNRVGFDCLRDELRQGATVLRDVAAAVVADVERCEAEVVSEPGPESDVWIAVVSLGREAPKPFGRGQTVHEDADLVARARIRRGQGLRGRGKVFAVVPKRHAEIEPALIAAEVVAPEAVDRRLQIVDDPGWRAGGMGLQRSGELEIRGRGGLQQAGFGDVCSRIDREPRNAVDCPN